MSVTKPRSAVALSLAILVAALSASTDSLLLGEAITLRAQTTPAAEPRTKLELRDADAELKGLSGPEAATTADAVSTPQQAPTQSEKKSGGLGSVLRKGGNAVKNVAVDSKGADDRDNTLTRLVESTTRRLASEGHDPNRVTVLFAPKQSEAQRRVTNLYEVGLKTMASLGEPDRGGAIVLYEFDQDGELGRQNGVSRTFIGFGKRAATNTRQVEIYLSKAAAGDFYGQRRGISLVQNTGIVSGPIAQLDAEQVPLYLFIAHDRELYKQYPDGAAVKRR